MAEIVIISGLSGAGRSGGRRRARGPRLVRGRQPPDGARSTRSSTSPPNRAVTSRRLGPCRRPAITTNVLPTGRCQVARQTATRPPCGCSSSTRRTKPNSCARYDATRRRHPLAGSGRLVWSSRFELERSELLDPVRTSRGRPGDRHHRPQRAPAEGAAPVLRSTEPVPTPGCRSPVESFGFKHGLPLDADLVLDVRFLPEPALA